jgi:hypothetical protein
LNPQSAPQTDHAPSQLTVGAGGGVGAEQSPSPKAQSDAVGHCAPSPDCAAVSVHVRAPACSHAPVHSDHSPAQFTLGGQLPSPGRQSDGTGHASPVPDCATASIQVLADATSHDAVHDSKCPEQSVLAGHSPSPGLHAAVAPSSTVHGVPVPAAGIVT